MLFSSSSQKLDNLQLEGCQQVLVDQRSPDTLVIPLDLDRFLISSAAKSLYIRFVSISQAHGQMVRVDDFDCFRSDLPNANKELLQKKFADAVQELVWFGTILVDIDESDEGEQSRVTYLVSPLSDWRQDRKDKNYPFPSININVLTIPDEFTGAIELNAVPSNKPKITPGNTRMQREMELRGLNYPWVKRWVLDRKTDEYFPVAHEYLVNFFFSQKNDFADKAHARNTLQRPGRWEAANDVYLDYLRFNEAKASLENIAIAMADQSKLPEEIYLENKVSKENDNFTNNFAEFSKLLEKNFGSTDFPLFKIIEQWVKNNSGKVKLVWRNNTCSLELI